DATNSSATNRKPTDCDCANSQGTDSDCANGQRAYGFGTNTLRPKPQIRQLTRRLQARKNLPCIVDQTTFTSWHSSFPKHRGDVDPKRPTPQSSSGALPHTVRHTRIMTWGVPADAATPCHRPAQLLVSLQRDPSSHGGPGAPPGSL